MHIISTILLTGIVTAAVHNNVKLRILTRPDVTANSKSTPSKTPIQQCTVTENALENPEFKLAKQLSSNEPFDRDFDALMTNVLQSNTLWSRTLSIVSFYLSESNRQAALCKSVLFLERTIDLFFFRYQEQTSIPRKCNIEFSLELKRAIGLTKESDYFKTIFERLSPDTRVNLVRLWSVFKLCQIYTSTSPFRPMYLRIEKAKSYSVEQWKRLKVKREYIVRFCNTLSARAIGEKSFDKLLGYCCAVCLIYGVPFEETMSMSEDSWSAFCAVYGDDLPQLNRKIVDRVFKMHELAN